MTFERPWILLLALIPLAWAAWQWPRAPRRLGLLLKALGFSAILAALSEPVMSTSETKTAVAVLVDTSASASKQDLEKASQFLNSLESARSRNWMRVLPFARGTRAVDPKETAKGWSLVNTASEAGRGTDLEGGIREALASVPAGLVPRVVLISDGRENSGSAARAAWQAKQLNIAVDVIPMQGRERPGIALESVSMPANAFSGERFAVEMVVNALHRNAARIELG